MPLLDLNVAFTDHAKVPALRNALEVYEEDRLNDALDIIRAVEEDLTQELAAAQDLFALIQATRGFVDDALADAIDTFQKFPHLAFGYNRASEMYMRKGQGLRATEVYEAGLKAIKEKGDPQQMSLLQKHRHEMELKYRDFIALLPLEITERIFEEFDYHFRLHTCANISTAWFPKAVYGMSYAEVGEHDRGLNPVAAGRLVSYVDSIYIAPYDTSYLAKFFGGIKEEGPSVGTFRSLRINAMTYDRIFIGLQKIILDGLRRIPQSLTSLAVTSAELISPLDLLASCPNLTMLECTCESYTAPLLQTKIPQRDKLTHLEIHNRRSKFEGEDLQRIIKVTPNVCFAKIPNTTSRVLGFVHQHWRRLQVLYVSPSKYDMPEYEIPGNEEFLQLQYCGYDMFEIYEYICQERTRLRSLFLECERHAKPFEFKRAQFPVLKYVHIENEDLIDPLKFPVLDLLQDATMLEELYLLCNNAYPETFEALTRMPKLKRLSLHVPFTQGVNLYLDHLASLGSASPLESITIHDQSLDDNQRAILSTRIPSLKDITIFTHIIERNFDDGWIIPLLNGLVQSESMVEKISIPDYAMTRSVRRTVYNLAALRVLEVVSCSHAQDPDPPEDFIMVRSGAPPVNVNFTCANDLGANIFYALEDAGIL